MSKSSQLRVYDIRQAYRLIGDCRDLAAVPEFWQQRMFDGLLALVGADRSAGGEGAWAGPQRDLQVLHRFLVPGLQNCMYLSSKSLIGNLMMASS